MNIQLAANQIGSTGDFVPSSLGAAGKKHYVSPVVKYVNGGMLMINTPVLNPFVEVEASASANFASTYEWEGATPSAGQAHRAQVSRASSGHHVVKIKKKSDGSTVDELNVWVIEATCTIKDLPSDLSDQGSWFKLQMGYKFEHEILPANVISAVDRPDLSGAQTTPPPPGGGLNYKGSALTGGVNQKWDSSRQIRQKVLNPGGVALPGDASFHNNFWNWPTQSDADGRTGGAGQVTYREARISGNDDAGTGDEDNNPYRSPDIGYLMGSDTPSRGIRHSEGANNDTVEYRLHFLEFCRLEINGTWYLISDYSPWRVHLKAKKVAGKWVNDGSNKAQDIAGF